MNFLRLTILFISMSQLIGDFVLLSGRSPVRIFVSIGVIFPTLWWEDVECCITDGGVVDKAVDLKYINFQSE